MIGIALVFLSVLAFRPRHGRGGGNTPVQAPVQSGAVVRPAGAAAAAASPAVIYDGDLQNGWENYSWAKVMDLRDTTQVRDGERASIRVQPEGYQAVYFHHAAMAPEGYDRLTFQVHGGDLGGQILRINAVFPDKKTATQMGMNTSYGKTLDPLPARKWRSVTVRLQDFGVGGQRRFNGFWLQNMSATAAPTYYIAGVRFLKPGEPAPAD